MIAAGLVSFRFGQERKGLVKLAVGLFDQVDALADVVRGARVSEFLQEIGRLNVSLEVVEVVIDPM
jgi:hypothetical protein